MKDIEFVIGSAVKHANLAHILVPHSAVGEDWRC